MEDMRPTPNPGMEDGRTEAQRKPETCNEVFDRFLAHCELRVSKDDMALSTLVSYREILDRVFRPAIGAEPFEGILYSQLAEVVADKTKDSKKKTYNKCLRKADPAISEPARAHATL